jgi:hypothetical protein
VSWPVATVVPVAPAASDAGHETGYDRIEVVGQAAGDGPIPLGSSNLAFQLAPRANETLLVARALGPPGSDFADGEPLTFLVRRASGTGRWIQCLAPAGADCQLREDGPDIVVEVGGRAIRVIEGADGAVVHQAGAPPARLSARGEVVWPEPPAPPPPAPTVVRVPLVARRPTLDQWPRGAVGFDLGERHYRRSEQPYSADRGIRARLELVADAAALCFRFHVVKPEVVVRPAGAPDPALDNEPADIHSDGVQCYVGQARWAGFLVVPELERGGIRVRAVAGTAARAADADGESRRTPDGYEMLVRCQSGAPLRPGDRLRFTAVVNEMRPGRERRAGQLALAGGGWVYLRGDRESPGVAFMAELT